MTFDDELQDERALAARLNLTENVAYARGLCLDLARILGNGIEVSRERAVCLARMAEIHLLEALRLAGASEATAQEVRGRMRELAERGLVEE